MKYKKTIILLVLAVFLLSITCVSASEIDNTIASEDANTIELSTDNDITEDNIQTSEENDELTLTDNDETLSAKNDTDVLSDNSGTYSGLSAEISSGGNIELQHDYYTYDTGNTISIIVPDSVIDGKGATIDMAGSNIPAFYVSASGVTIKNLTIINANYDGYGGAIYFGGSGTGTVTNCNFINNKATGTVYGGGAVFFFITGNVTNCNFTNNTAYSGGAVYFLNTGNVTNCNFINNKATDTVYTGGAVYFMDSGTVTNCNFTDNTATSDGGAVYFRSTGAVTNCNFIDNKATRDYASGGAVCFFYEGIVIDSNFTDNSAGYGGAICFDASYDKDYVVIFDIHSTGVVANCNFNGNHAGQGGAIRFSGGGDVSNCNFTNNKATGTDFWGGAVYFNGDGTVRDCNFTNNKADGYGVGGAIFFRSSDVVKNSNFKNNFATFCSDIFRISQPISIANAKVKLSKTVFSYNGKVHKPTVTITLNNTVLQEDVEYYLKWSASSPKKAGTYKIEIFGEWIFDGTITVKFKIDKGNNPLKVKAKTANVKFFNLKKKTQVLKVSSVVKFSNKGQGTLTYNKVNGNKKISINKKTGKVTIKKGLKKGTYNVKIKIKAKGNANYKPSAFKTLTFKIKIK